MFCFSLHIYTYIRRKPTEAIYNQFNCDVCEMRSKDKYLSKMIILPKIQGKILNNLTMAEWLILRVLTLQLFA